MRKWKGPQIPRSLLHSMYEVHTEGGGYDKEQGGQWKPGTTVETAFQGVVMPLNNEDLQYIDSGSYTLNAQKVYTNGHTLQVGAQFRDGFDGQIYTVKQELTHGPVHSIFLSTPSARRATKCLTKKRRYRTISIHALREEGDRGRSGC